MTSNIQHCKMSVVNASSGTVDVSCVAEFFWSDGSSILRNLKSKLVTVCKGVCDLRREPLFDLYFIDKEGDPIILTGYDDLYLLYSSSRKPDEDKLVQLYAFLPPGPPRPSYIKKTGQAPTMTSKEEADLKGNIEELTKAVRVLTDLLVGVREDWHHQKMKMLTEDSSSEILEPIMK